MLHLYIMDRLSLELWTEKYKASTGFGLEFDAMGEHEFKRWWCERETYICNREIVVDVVASFNSVCGKTEK